MRRFLAFTLLALISFSLLSAFAIDCNPHAYIETTVPVERISHVEYSSLGHTVHYEELLTCYLCGAENWIPRRSTPIEHVPHDYSVQQRDLGHTVGDIHQYVMGCSTAGCPHTITLEVLCNDLCESWRNRLRPTVPETE